MKISAAEAVGGYRLETFGGIFALTRKAIVNDDLGALAQWAAPYGAGLPPKRKPPGSSAC